MPAHQKLKHFFDEYLGAARMVRGDAETSLPRGQQISVRTDKPMSSIDNNRLVDQGELSFKELADNAPVMIWRSGPDKLCNWFNKPWLDFVGRTMEQELGNGWVENVQRDDVD